MIRIIVAVDQKRGVAKHGVQPWLIPADEAYFSRQTKSLGARVLMGRKTLEVMGKPLDDRANYLLTRSGHGMPGVQLVHDLNNFLDTCIDEDIWVIGGESVYMHTIDRADQLYVTHILADFGCDQFFPEIPTQNFSLSEQSEMQSQNGFNYHYTIYNKRQPPK